MTNMGEDSSPITIASPGNTGRPRNEVTLEQIHGQWETLGVGCSQTVTKSFADSQVAYTIFDADN